LAISIESSIRGRCAGNIETALYRIVQEALTNVCKHACASKVSIRLAKHQRKIRCAIRDDGNGFDAAALNRASAQKGLGLVGIRERINAFGGTLLVKSDPGNGTELLVEIPTED
jgi:signal transduction histidine kinase